MAKHSETATSPEGFASGLSNRALHCRELGHNWRAHTVRWDRKAKCYDRTLRCAGCHTLRVEVLTRHAEVVKYHYVYAKGYLATGVEGRVYRQTFRMEAINRVMAESGPNLKAV